MVEQSTRENQLHIYREMRRKMYEKQHHSAANSFVQSSNHEETKGSEQRMYGVQADYASGAYNREEEKIGQDIHDVFTQKKDRSKGPQKNIQVV